MTTPNERSTATGTAGFYYTRGDDVPVTIIGADDRKSIGVDVPFNDGNEQLYLDLFQYGLDGEFPEEANFDRIRGWCDEKVLDLRRQLRDDLESCLRDDDLTTPFGLEELLVLAQVFLYNARTGRWDIDRDDVLSIPELEDSSPFGPGSDRFDLPAGIQEGCQDLTLRRSDVQQLCEGFFLLKGSFVDYDRLSVAHRHVTENLNEYIDAAARISASELQKAYRIGTSRSDANGSTKVKSFFTTISDYANELQKLVREFDAETIETELEGVRSLYSNDHTSDELLAFYNRLEKSFSPLDASLESDWVRIGDSLQDGSANLSLKECGETLRRFEDLDPDNGLEVIEIMHEYNRSVATQDAWAVYEILEEMIQVIEDHDDADGGKFVDELKSTPEFTAFQHKREKTVRALEGI